MNSISKYRKAEWTVGVRVVVIRPLLKLEIGTAGYIIQTQPASMGGEGHPDVTIIFENGVCETVSVGECLKTLHKSFEPHPTYCEYDFEDMSIVEKNFQAGYWKFHKKKRRD